MLSDSSNRDNKKRRAFSIVFLPTLACNCTCSHCFERLSKRHQDNQDFEKIFTKIHELAEIVDCQVLRVYWQGGEVLCLSPEKVSEILETSKNVFDGNEIEVEHHLQTNLLLYDTAKWKDVLQDFSLGTISSSVDFPNVYRKTPTLSVEEYSGVWVEKKKIAEEDGFKVSVISLPNEKTLEKGAKHFYSYIKNDLGLNNVQINFPFPGVDNDPASLDLEHLTKFMMDLYDIWVASGRDLNLSPYRAMEDRMLRNTGSLACCWSYNCASVLLAIGPDGSIGQCDCWIANMKEYNFGSIEQSFDEIFDSENRKLFIERPIKLIQDTKCGECKFWKLCNGGCAVRAMTFNKDIFTPDHYCPVYYAMFSKILDNAGQEIQLNINQLEDINNTEVEYYG